MSEQNPNTTFYIARHGNTEWNNLHLIQGHSDSPLTEEGLTQARDLAEKLRGIKFDLIFSSDLMRAKKTADIVALEHQLAVETTNLLRERSYGVAEGRHNDEYKQTEQTLASLTSEERYRYKSDDHVESDEDIVNRFTTFIREVAIAKPGKTILAITHGGIMRAFLIKLGFATYDGLKRGGIPNAAYIKLHSDGVDFDIDEVTGLKKDES